ncbi:MAG: 3-methylfumaryl-CoA hydratase [Halioglobus sp.]|jgi:3-methylfumaryl-CoA hydratase
MSMSEEIAIDHLRSWIGRQEQEIDTITPELLKRFRATLNAYTAAGAESSTSIPLGIHWCLALPALSSEELGPDGHPAKGGFLPPAPLPRRMWASSRIQFRKPPTIGVPIERISTIADVVLKKSATAGALVFVQIDHTYTENTGNAKETLIEESQTIVYRQAVPFKHSDAQETRTVVRTLTLVPDSTLLSRYSGLTFNGHRIHYDHKYATSVEGYPALVVHGPLMATILMNLAQANRGDSPLHEFEFRGVAPAFVDEALQFDVNDDAAESLEVRNSDNTVIMTASAQFSG